MREAVSQMSTTRVLATPAQAYARGCSLVLMAGVWLSAGGLIVRQITVADDWQIVVYRSSGAAAALLLLLVLRDRSAVLVTFRRAGLPGLVAGLAMAVSMITFILAVNATSVANALFLLAVAPFLAALLGWLLLRERVSGVTWLAMAGALVGITIMVWHGITVGTLFGNAMGLLTALGFAVFTVALRAGRTADMLPAVCLAGLISAGVAAAAVTGSGAGFVIPFGEVALCLLYGALIAGALAIYTIGSRTVPTAELTLLSLTEVLLGPVWVWLGVGEVPDLMTIVGGAVLLAAIAGLAVHGMLRR